MGSNFGDLDNDGWLDFYLGTGYPRYEALMPNVMYRNRRRQALRRRHDAGGFGHLQKGHGVAFADFDHDGDQDVFAQMGGAFPGDRAPTCFYENPGFGNHWLDAAARRHALEPLGDRRAHPRRDRRRTARGDRSTARQQRRQLRRQSAAPDDRSRQGDTSCDVLEVFWPTSGETQTWTNVRADQAIRIVEGEASYSDAGAEADHARTRRGPRPRALMSKAGLKARLYGRQIRLYGRPLRRIVAAGL